MVDQELLTVAEALKTIVSGVSVLGAERVPLLEALGRVLAEPVVAGDRMPPFANSAMDGYAVRAVDVAAAGRDTAVTLRVLADIAAGTMPEVSVTAGTAVRIMTGAPLPEGADAIIPVEDTDESWRGSERPLPPEIAVFRAVDAGDYVRPAGEDIEAGQEVVAEGHVIRPQEVAVLAALGRAEVAVIRRPRVGILATGDELIDITEPLTPGKIRNSNGYAQAAQVLAVGGIPVSLGVAGDSEEAVRRHLQKGLDAGVDMFISSAGVSVGAYDVVKAVLAQAGNVDFWRVRMRPGKPLAFGDYQGIPYLGLPGNPVSAMVSFERFARPAIRKMAGFPWRQPPSVPVTTRDDIESDGRESYIRAIVSRGEEGYVAVLTGAQGSNIMTSLVKANALLVVPEGVRHVPVGTPLQALMIDWPETVF